MAITEISPIETVEYGKHYGKTHDAFVADGQGLSSPSVLKGTVRGIYDEVILDEPLLWPNRALFGWKFSQRATILDGSIQIKTSVVGSGIIYALLYSEDSLEGEQLAILFGNRNTDVTSEERGLYLQRPIANVPKGAVVLFSTTDARTIKTGVHIIYTLTFMSAL